MSRTSNRQRFSKGGALRLGFAGWGDEEQGICGNSPGQLIHQNHIQQRLMYADAAVVFNQAKLPEAVHEKVDAGPGGADHLRQGLL
jgi:hypothetical protein